MSEYEKEWENEAERSEEELVPTNEQALENAIPEMASSDVTQSSPQESDLEVADDSAGVGEEADNVVPFHKIGAVSRSDPATALEELEARGFTEDEALRLIQVSDTLATSREAREAEATLRRLRFTQWLVAHGILDEFSA